MSIRRSPRKTRSALFIGAAAVLASAATPIVAAAQSFDSSFQNQQSSPSNVANQKHNVQKFRHKIKHIIVIYQENWSFDGLYGSFPGANGLQNAVNAPKQVDKSGIPYVFLPQNDPHIPQNLPNAPFAIEPYVAPADKTRDLVHRFYTHQLQIDGGLNDKFVAWSDALGLTMSHFDATNLPEGRLAQQYTMADNFFQGAFGGSFLNHFWLISAQTPVWPNAPANKISNLDPAHFNDNAVTPDGYVVNTAFSINQPHPPNITDPTQLVPQQTFANIGDRLDNKGITWAWFAGGWNDALAGHPDPLFQYHHQPFAYFARYADGTKAKALHLRDETEFLSALGGRSLPSVSFVKPLGTDNEHPGYTSLLRGQQHVADIVSAVQQSQFWKDTAIIITYDEFGGRWDHVAPPVVDRWGPGTRVPAIIISRFAKRGFVDHTQYDTTSILKTIETRYNLAPLSTRDANANDLLNSFDFGK